MSTVTESDTGIIETERGLTIAGTRITVYDVMDYVKADWPPKLIRDRLELTNKQIEDVMNYIEVHRSAVETEYEEVLQAAEETRRYWEERNRERLEQIANMPPKPGQEEIRAKLKAWRERLEAEERENSG